MRRSATFVTMSLALAAPGAGAQLAQRVADVDDARVRFSYEVRPDVEICPQGVRIGEQEAWWRHGREDPRASCHSDEAEVEMDVRGGTVRNIELVRTAVERSGAAVDLGRVDPEEASRFLLSLAYEGATSGAAEDAILPALLSDVEEPWPLLLDIARDRELDQKVRKSALFWIGQGAASAATEGLAEVAVDGDEAQSIRDAAIFALSQRSSDEAVPLLIEIARTGEAETRRTAMFWLAQSDDERVVQFFEEVLLGRIR